MDCSKMCLVGFNPPVSEGEQSMTEDCEDLKKSYKKIWKQFKLTCDVYIQPSQGRKSATRDSQDHYLITVSKINTRLTSAKLLGRSLQVQETNYSDTYRE